MIFLDSNIISTPLIISAVTVTIAVISLAFICDTNKSPFDTKCIAFAGISVALSFGLSFIKLFQMPLGGSITLASTLPLLIFSYVYGTKKGVLVGIILGLLNMITGLSYAVHPAQVILDYVIAYGAMGLVGMFSKVNAIRKIPVLEFVLGSLCSGVIRFISHVVAGIFAWETPIWASMAYNSFIFVDLAIAVFLGIFVFSSKSLVKIIDEKRKFNNK